jgi:hypothetical protein
MQKLTILIGCMGIMLSTIVYAAPYATAVDVPDSQFKSLFPDTSKEMAEMMGKWPIVKKEDIPDASSIAAPAYPNALITKLVGRHKVRPGKYKGLATIQLVSEDAFDKVENFYAKELAGWSKQTYSNGKSVYWAKTGLVEVNTKAMKEPQVRVTDLTTVVGGGEWQKKLVPDAQTLIEVYYLPTN